MDFPAYFLPSTTFIYQSRLPAWNVYRNLRCTYIFAAYIFLTIFLPKILEKLRTPFVIGPLYLQMSVEADMQTDAQRRGHTDAPTDERKHGRADRLSGFRYGYGLKSGQTCGKMHMDEQSVEGLTGVQMHGQTRPRREYRSDGRTHGYGKAFRRTGR